MGRTGSVTATRVREDLAAWSRSSRRFRAFAEAYDTKIAKKLRGCVDGDSALDLRLELACAHLLLRERPFDLVYEPGKASGGRSADFEVRYTTSLAFALEVARLRPRNGSAGTTAASSAADGEPPDAFAQAYGAPFQDLVSRKLGQLAPGMANVLLVGVDAPQLDDAGLGAVMLHLQQRIEGGDGTLLDRHGIAGRGGFFRRYQRLSAVAVLRFPSDASGAPAFWGNPQARIALPNKVRAALVRGLTGEP